MDRANRPSDNVCTYIQKNQLVIGEDQKPSSEMQYDAQSPNRTVPTVSNRNGYSSSMIVDEKAEQSPLPKPVKEKKKHVREEGDSNSLVHGADTKKTRKPDLGDGNGHTAELGMEQSCTYEVGPEYLKEFKEPSPSSQVEEKFRNSKVKESPPSFIATNENSELETEQLLGVPFASNGSTWPQENREISGIEKNKSKEENSIGDKKDTIRKALDSLETQQNENASCVAVLDDTSKAPANEVEGETSRHGSMSAPPVYPTVDEVDPQHVREDRERQSSAPMGGSTLVKNTMNQPSCKRKVKRKVFCKKRNNGNRQWKLPVFKKKKTKIKKKRMMLALTESLHVNTGTQTRTWRPGNRRIDGDFVREVNLNIESVESLVCTEGGIDKDADADDIEDDYAHGVQEIGPVYAHGIQEIGPNVPTEMEQCRVVYWYMMHHDDIDIDSAGEEYGENCHTLDAPCSVEADFPAENMVLQ